MHRVVDAMNVIGSRPDGWWRDRAGAIERLVDRVDRWAEDILTKNPTCIEILKATFDAEIDEMSGSMRRYVQLMAPNFPLGQEVKEAQTAFWEKRAPDFWQFRTGS